MAIMKIAIESVPELLFRLKFEDSAAAAQIDLISQSKSLISDMLKNRNPTISALAPVIALINKNTAAWLGKLAIFGGVAQDRSKDKSRNNLQSRNKFQDKEDEIRKGIERNAQEIIEKVRRDRRGLTENLRKQVEDNLPSKEEMREIIRSLPKDEIEKCKEALREIEVETSNKNIIAYHFHENEIRTSWLVNTVYGILTGSKIRRAFPLPEDAVEIKKNIKKCIQEGKPIELVGFWGGYKESKSGRADKADKFAISRLKETVDKLKDIGVDSKVIFYFADIYAISKLVGRSTKLYIKMTDYFDDIEKMTKENGFEIIHLSKSIYGLSADEINRIGEIPYEKLFREEIIEQANRIWKNVDTKTREVVLDAAKKHTTEIGEGEKDLEDAALGYIGCKLFENEWLNEIHKDGIFFSYGNPLLVPFCPAKTIFWYSFGRLSNPPWYTEMKEEG